MRRARRLLLAALAGAVLATSCSIETKDFDALFGDDFSVDTLETAQSSRVYDRNGILITELRGEQNRTDIRYDQMPEVLVNAGFCNRPLQCAAPRYGAARQCAGVADHRSA